MISWVSGSCIIYLVMHPKILTSFCSLVYWLNMLSNTSKRAACSFLSTRFIVLRQHHSTISGQLCKTSYRSYQVFCHTAGPKYDTEGSIATGIMSLRKMAMRPCALAIKCCLLSSQTASVNIRVSKQLWLSGPIATSSCNAGTGGEKCATPPIIVSAMHTEKVCASAQDRSALLSWRTSTLLVLAGLKIYRYKKGFTGQRIFLAL